MCKTLNPFFIILTIHFRVLSLFISDNSSYKTILIGMVDIELVYIKYKW